MQKIQSYNICVQPSSAHLPGTLSARCGLGIIGLMLVWFSSRAVFASPALSQLDLAIYVGIFIASAGLCLMRAWVSSHERAAWILIGLGLLFWAGGEYYLDFQLSTSNPPFPSPADGGYLLFYPLVSVALVLLARKRLPRLRNWSWLNGCIGALAALTLTALLLYQSLVHTSGSLLTVATTLTYPLADLLLLGILFSFIGAFGWRMSRSFLLIAVAIGAFWISDTAYFIGNANGSWISGEWTCLGWPLAALLLAVAAWQRPRASIVAATERNRRTLAVPIMYAMLVSLLLIYGNFAHINIAAEILAVATLLCLLIRMLQVFKNAHNAVAQMEAASRTDALTLLGNRRKLQADLELIVIRTAHGGEGAAFVIFDLNGFKAYNDTFGHPAGDDLLRRLGNQLKIMVEDVGEAYRLGGDEFCLLLPIDDRLPSLINAATAALSESGEGFAIDAAYGMAELPTEAQTVSAAMKFADRRMYAQKAGGRASVGSQMRDVLLQTVSERDGDLGEHNDDVAALARRVAESLRLTSEQIEETVRAAELHDIGKVAVPDKILFKPGPLTDQEWASMRLHTIIGEKILAAAPALAPVAHLVRASHEHWDGNGYPDQLCGQAIPLGSRIVAVCDAYDAMVTDRPYRKGCPSAEALTELQACSGSQFDPQVVECFVNLKRIQGSEGDSWQFLNR